MASITDILINATHPTDANIRNQALQLIEKAKEGKIEDFIGILMGELGDETKPEQSRQQAGLLLKNFMVSRNVVQREEIANRWKNVSADVRESVKQVTMQTMSSPTKKAREVSSLIAAVIFRVEVPHNQWPDLIPNLCKGATPQTANSHQRESCILCLKYICEEVSYKHLTQSAIDIAKCLVNGCEENDMNVKRESITALCAAFEIMGPVMELEPLRAYLMKVVLGSAQNAQLPLEIREEAMSCLVKAVSLYYPNLKNEMNDVYTVTEMILAGGEETLKCTALELWSAMCEVEQDILDDPSPTKAECMHYVKGAAKMLIPHIWMGLLSQDEDAEENDWNFCFASGHALQTISTIICDDVVALVFPYVEKHLHSQEWKYRDAAVMAFGSVLDGPSFDTVQNVLPQVLATLFDMVDQNQTQPLHPLFLETIVWTLGRFAEFKYQLILNDEQLTRRFLTGMMIGATQYPPRIAEKACFAIHGLAENAPTGDDEELQANQLTAYFHDLLNALIAAVDREDGRGTQLPLSALETINSLLSTSALESRQHLVSLFPMLTGRLEHSIAIYRDAVTSDAKEQVACSQGLYVSVIGSVSFKLGQMLREGSEEVGRLMAVFMQLLEQDNSNVQEEVLLALGHVCNGLGESFSYFLSGFSPILMKSLEKHDHTDLCRIAVGCTVEVIAACGPHIEPYAAQIVEKFLGCLKAPHLDVNVKPSIMSAFGDVATAIEGKFVPYLPDVMQVLHFAVGKVSQEQASSPEDEDLEIYLFDIYENVCECYTGILLGMKDQKGDSLRPHIQQMLAHVLEIASSPVTTGKPTGLKTWKSSVGLIGDLASTYGHEMTETIRKQQPICDLVNLAKQQTHYLEIQEVGTYAINELQNH